MIYFKTDGRMLPKVTYAGSVSIAAPNRHFPRKPFEYIIYYITAGRMDLKEGETVYSLTEGDLLILDPSRAHDGIPTMSDVSYIYVHFLAELTELDIAVEEKRELVLGQALSEDAPEELIFSKYIHVPERYRNEIKSLLESIVNDMHAKVPYYKTLCPLALIRVWTYLGSVDDVGVSPDNTVLKLLRFIENNYRLELSSEVFEQEFNLNYDYMNRLFKGKTGMTIMAYVNKLKIRESKVLLRTGMYSVQKVAKQLGFANEFYFSRVFKKLEGHSPSEEMKN